jgi:hypothetical protein
MTMTNPDFFMGSSESNVLAVPRRCWRLQRIKATNRADDLLLVRVDPPIPGEPFGYKGAMDVVIVATHSVGDSLFPINTFPASPLAVYVCRPRVDGVEKRDQLASNEIEMFDWAELYPSEAEARAKLTYSEAQRLGRKI